MRNDGLDNLADSDKGRSPGNCGDALTAEGIASLLKTDGVFQVEVRETVTSTNTVLREMAANNAPEGLVLAAEGQTAGKGRQGRDFHSPAGCGAYFSLLLRPGASGADALLITSAAAVAAARAIEEIFGVRVGIKWVNDLFMDGKKVCGILTEAVIGTEGRKRENHQEKNRNGGEGGATNGHAPHSGQEGREFMVTSAVLGIGINITSPEQGYPEGIRGVATALTYREQGKSLERCRLISSTLDNFWKYYQNLAGRGFLDEYRRRSIVLGRDIYVLSGGSKRPARALAIDDNCGLVVRYEDGEAATLGYGEVSIRL